MPSLRYKFPSSLVYDTLHFDGSYASVGELMTQIAIRERINPEHYGLQLSDAQTGEDYADDAFIPQGSSVIVRRTSLWSEASRPAVTSMSPSSEPAPVGSPAAVPSQSTQTVDPAALLLPMNEEPLSSTFTAPSSSGNIATAARVPVCVVRPLQLIEQELRAAEAEAEAVPPPQAGHHLEHHGDDVWADFPPEMGWSSDGESSSGDSDDGRSIFGYVEEALILCPQCDVIPSNMNFMPLCGHAQCPACEPVPIGYPAHLPLPAYPIQLVRCPHSREPHPPMVNIWPPSPEGPPVVVHQAGHGLMYFDEVIAAEEEEEVPQALEEQEIPAEGSIPLQAFVPPGPEAPGMPPSAQPPSAPLPANRQRSERDLARERNNRRDLSRPGRRSSRSRRRSRTRRRSRSHRRYDGYRRSRPHRSRSHRSRQRTPPPRGFRSRSPAGRNPPSSRHGSPPRRERIGREDGRGSRHCPPSSSSRANTSSEVAQARRTERRQRARERQEWTHAGEGPAPTRRRRSRSPSVRVPSDSLAPSRDHTSAHTSTNRSSRRSRNKSTRPERAKTRSRGSR